MPAWLVFEAVPTKLPHYTLPLFPALCLLAGCWIASPAHRRPARAWAVIAVALSVAAALVLGGGGTALPFVVAPDDRTGWVFAGIALVAGLAMAWRVGRNAGDSRAATLALATVPLLSWSLLFLELPRLQGLWVASEVRAALANDPGLRGQGAFELGSVGYAEPSLMFLGGTDTRFLNTAQQGAQFMSRGGRVLLVEGRSEPAFLAAASALGEHLARFATVAGFNYSNGRRVHLNFYRTVPAGG